MNELCAVLCIFRNFWLPDERIPSRAPSAQLPMGKRRGPLEDRKVVSVTGGTGQPPDSNLCQLSDPAACGGRVNFMNTLQAIKYVTF